jgi:curved DNA-binding protein CbpA
MNNPYETLGLPAEADEAQIRSRYLQLVKEFPPDRAPERFASIRAAYDELRNPAALLEKQLFSLTTHDSLEALQLDIVRRLEASRFPMALILSLADAP